MTKFEWIRARYNTSPEKNIPLFTSILNTQSLVANPVPRATVPKPISILQVASNLSANDRRLLQNEGAYSSLIENVNKGDLMSAQADIQNLATTPQISPAAIATLQTALEATTQTEPDPNWQSQIMASPAELAGYGVIYRNEVEEAM